MRELIVACFTVLLLVTMLTGRATFTSMAKEETMAASHHESTQTREEDNLWKIADQHKEGNSMSTHECVDRLIQMNNPKKDATHTGQYLTVVYFEQFFIYNIVSSTSQIPVRHRPCLACYNTSVRLKESDEGFVMELRLLP